MADMKWHLLSHLLIVFFICTLRNYSLMRVLYFLSEIVEMVKRNSACNIILFYCNGIIDNY